MSQELYRSWHIPHSKYMTEEDIPVVFMQRRSQESINQVLENLNNYDEDCIADHDPVMMGKLQSYPWIRDNNFEQNTVCAFLHNILRRRDHEEPVRGWRASILIETDYQHSDCIVVASRLDDQKKFYLSAARVAIQHARPLASLVRESNLCLEQAIGEGYDEQKVDLAEDYPPQLDVPHIDLPELPDMSDVKLSGEERITIISTLPHGQVSIEQLKERLHSEDIEINLIDRLDRSITRAELYHLIIILEQQNTAEDHIGYIFIVDNIFQEDGQPQIVAVSRVDNYGTHTSNHEISLLPVRAAGVIALWRACMASNGTSKHVEKYGTAPAASERENAYIFQRERVRDPQAMFIANECDALIWYLRPFSVEEERQIRLRFAEPERDGADMDEVGHEFRFAGYPFADDGQQPHTVEELALLFQKCDQYSPAFDSTYSKLRFDGYPHHFFAIDERVLDKDSPGVALVSSGDFYHPSHQLGWVTGTIEPNYAWCAYVNLDIANMGPEEMFEDSQKVWLDDLKCFAKAYNPEDDDDE